MVYIGFFGREIINAHKYARRMLTSLALSLISSRRLTAGEEDCVRRRLPLSSDCRLQALNSGYRRVSVSVSVCLCVCVCVCMCVCVRVCVCARARVLKCVCTHINVCMLMCVCKCLYVCYQRYEIVCV